MKTIRNLADELGVTKAAIRKRFNEDFRAKYITIDDNGTLFISDDGCEIIKKSVRAKPNKADTMVDTGVDTGTNRDTQGLETDSDTLKMFVDTTKQAIETNSDTLDTLKATIDLLSEQLRVKDSQITELNNTIAALQITLNQSQQLQGALLKQLGTSEQTEQPEPKGITKLFRVFRKK